MTGCGGGSARWQSSRRRRVGVEAADGRPAEGSGGPDRGGDGSNRLVVACGSGSHSRVPPRAARREPRGDSSHPEGWAVYSAAFLVLVGAAFAAPLVAFGPERPRGAHKIAGTIVVAIVLIAGGGAAARSEPRCFFESYTQETTCASGGDALLADLAMILLPGALAVACLAVGAQLERRSTLNQHSGRP